MEGEMLQLPELGVVGRPKTMHSAPADRLDYDRALSSSFQLKLEDIEFDGGDGSPGAVSLENSKPSATAASSPPFKTPPLVPWKGASSPSSPRRPSADSASAQYRLPSPPQQKVLRSGWQPSPRQNFTNTPKANQAVRNGWPVIPKNNFKQPTQSVERKKRPVIRRPYRDTIQDIPTTPRTERNLSESSFDVGTSECRSPSPLPLKPQSPGHSSEERLWSAFMETCQTSQESKISKKHSPQKKVQILEPVLHRNRSASASEAMCLTPALPVQVKISARKGTPRHLSDHLGTPRTARSHANTRDVSERKTIICTPKNRKKLRPVVHVKYKKWEKRDPNAAIPTQPPQRQRRQRQKFNEASWRAIRKFKHRAIAPGSRPGSGQRVQLLTKLRKNVIRTEVDALGSVVVGRQENLKNLEESDDLENFVLPEFDFVVNKSLDDTKLPTHEEEDNSTQSRMNSSSHSSNSAPGSPRIQPFQCKHHSSNVSPGMIERKKKSIEYGNQASVIFKYEDELKRISREKVAEFKKLVGCERASVFLADRTTKSLYLMPVESTKWIKLPMAEGIAGYVVMNGLTLNIPDAYKDPRFNQAVDKKFGLRTKSILCVPLREEVATAHVVGCIQMINKIGQEDYFTQEDEMVMEMCASKLTEIMSQYGLKMLMSNNKF